jgi:catechol 2,3-dioxygenase-like lactoylglutathione lyase family enzyme
MITRLDHVRIESGDFAACCKSYERLLGRATTLAGESPASRAELALENCALVLQAGACDGARLGSLVFASDDLESARRALTSCGAFARPTSTGGAPAGDAFVTDAYGVDVTIVGTPARALLGSAAPSALNALDHVVVRTADVARARSLYGGALGLRLALEREFRGVRMLFFRIAGVTVEVVEDPASARDLLHGLAYRTRDIHAAHARMRDQGMTLSEVRPGRKEGTHVFTVREGACDIPTLVLSDPARV